VPRPRTESTRREWGDPTRLGRTGTPGIWRASRRAKVLNTLSLIEQRLNRNIQANLKLLIKLQDRRIAAEEGDARPNKLVAEEPKPFTRSAGTAVSLAGSEIQTPEPALRNVA
jgi:hypothetical protein